MPQRHRPPYDAEFRQRIIDLVRNGRTPAELAREFEPNAQTIANWVKQVDLDSGARSDGLTSAERDELRALRRENRRLKEEKEIQKKKKKCHGLVRRGERLDPQAAWSFVMENQAEHAVATMCDVLGVSRSGYYAWRDCEPSIRAREDEVLKREIREIHAGSGRSYGSRRVRAELRYGLGRRIGRGRVRRLMREQKLVTITRRKWTRTTTRDGSRQPEPDLVRRDFTASRPDELWVADITYIRTDAGFLFLVVVIDVFSCRVVGWAMATHMRTELVLDALQMALRQRRPANGVHHSDQGSQYTSLAFGRACRDAGVRLSMGRVADCHDNAMGERFFGTLECELLDWRRFEDAAAARAAVFVWLEGWYNTRRRHSALGYMSPVEYEAHFKKQSVRPVHSTQKHMAAATCGSTSAPCS